MRVIATARGFDNIKTREVDEEFDMPDGAEGTWFRTLDEPAAAPAKAAGKTTKAPKTLSESGPKASVDPDPSTLAGASPQGDDGDLA